VTYKENQPPVIVTRDEVRQIAWLAWAVLDPETIHPAQRRTLREAAKDVISWCDGTLIWGENDDPQSRVLRMKPITFDIKGYYTNEHLPRVLDETPDAVIEAQPVYVQMLRQCAEFIDFEVCGGHYSTEARLETLADYERILGRLAACTEEYLAELVHPDDQDDEIDDEEHLERSTNGAH
jgi:hypothetical protein